MEGVGRMSDHRRLPALLIRNPKVPRRILGVQVDLVSQRHRSQSYLLVFDGECDMCRRSVDWIRRRDAHGVIEALPYQDPSVVEQFPEIPRRAFERAIQLVRPEGARLEGARAVEEILRLIPRTRPMAPFFRVPGVRWLAQRIYQIVARNRRRFGCGDHCSAPARGSAAGD